MCLFGTSLGEPWPDKKIGPIADNDLHPGCSRTQRRQIAGFLKMFCLGKQNTTAEREVVAAEIDLDLAVLEESARLINVIKIRDGPLLKKRGTIGMKILEAISVTAQTLNNLLKLGMKSGFWGIALGG